MTVNIKTRILATLGEPGHKRWIMANYSSLAGLPYLEVKDALRICPHLAASQRCVAMQVLFQDAPRGLHPAFQSHMKYFGRGFETRCPGAPHEQVHHCSTCYSKTWLVGCGSSHGFISLYRDYRSGQICKENTKKTVPNLNKYINMADIETVDILYRVY